MAQSGFDRRRINGPEESFSPLYDDEGETQDQWKVGRPRVGRGPANIRPICESLPARCVD